jgi:hypothetical protein
MKTGSTLEDLAGRIPKDFLENMKYARVWGKLFTMERWCRKTMCCKMGTCRNPYINKMRVLLKTHTIY